MEPYTAGGRTRTWSIPIRRSYNNNTFSLDLLCLIIIISKILGTVLPLIRDIVQLARIRRSLKQTDQCQNRTLGVLARLLAYARPNK